MLNQWGLVCPVFLLLSSWLTAQVPSSQPFANKWEFSAFFGSSHRGDTTFLAPQEENTSTPVGQNFASGYLVGVRITENFAKHFGAELEYSLANHPLEFTNLAPVLPSLRLANKVHQFAYTILFYPYDRQIPIRPFLSAGIGTSLFQTPSDSKNQALDKNVEVKDRWKLAFYYGGGIKYQKNRNWGFRLDIRDQLTGVPNYGIPSNGPAETRIRPDGVLHNWQFSLGLMYAFEVR